jgi:uncharacterized membrane protein YkvA (DUF1232 family)
MELLLYIVLGVVVVTVVLGMGLWLLWRRVTREERQLIRRVTKLRLGSKLRLAGALIGDRRIPLAARAVLPAIVLYLAMPIDIIPDFIPVIGVLDDVFLIVVGLNLLLRLVPRRIIEQHISQLEIAEIDARAIEATLS